jgi:hypothetical protein
MRNLKTYIEQSGQNGKNAECAIYTRDASGVIERTGHRINGNQDANQYQHEERLQGWPERRVFWVDATGPSIGAAPIAF